MRISGLPKIIRRRKSLARGILAFVAGLAAMFVTLIITQPPGPGLDPDSASYLGAAQSLASGDGYRVPIAGWASADSMSALAHFPPGYPTALALPISLGMRPLQSARLVDAAAAFLDIGLITWLAALAAGVVPAVILAIALLLIPSFLQAHLRVLSEPLFLTCLVATLAAMHAEALTRTERERLGWSVAAGCASAAAVAVRYVGISASAAAAVWSLLLPGTLRERVRRTVAGAVPWILVLGAWVIRTEHAGGTGAIRNVGAYGGMADTIRQGLATVVAWVVPLSPDDSLPGRRWVALAVALLGVLTVGRGLAHRRAEIRARTVEPREGAASRIALTPLVSSALLLALSYAAMLIASRLFADPDIPFDDRLLLPLFLLAMVVAAITIRSWWSTTRLPARVLCAAIVVLWMLASYHVSSDDIDWAMENGYDLAGDPWRSSALIAWARGHAAGHVIFSNWPSAVVLQLHRPSRETPADADTLVLQQFATTVAARDGVILAFDIAAPNLIGVDALLREPRLKRIAQLSDGSVFMANPAPRPR